MLAKMLFIPPTTCCLYHQRSVYHKQESCTSYLSTK